MTIDTGFVVAASLFDAAIEAKRRQARELAGLTHVLTNPTHTRSTGPMIQSVKFSGRYADVASFSAEVHIEHVGASTSAVSIDGGPAMPAPEVHFVVRGHSARWLYDAVNSVLLGYSDVPPERGVTSSAEAPGVLPVGGGKEGETETNFEGPGPITVGG